MRTKHLTESGVTSGPASRLWKLGLGEERGSSVPLLPTTEPNVMPLSHAIIFAPGPISTWEQCKLVKTCFSGPAIIIMMISISVAIASDYLAGNFCCPGALGLSRQPTRIVGSEGLWRKRKWPRRSTLLINKLKLEIFTSRPHKGTAHKLI